MLPVRRRFSTGSYINSYHWEYHEAGSLFRSSSPLFDWCRRSNMVDPNKVQHNVTLFTMPPNATEVLQRLRDSYSALSEGDVLTGPDQAVLAAVKITLKHLSRAG
jgi:hypothetical protein